jgi:hypothetical protein
MGYSKSVIAILATIVSAIVAGLTGDQTISPVEWINVAIAGATAASVFVAPNSPSGRLTKGALAFIMAVLVLAVNLIADGVTLSEWLQLLVAGCAAVGVYAVRNAPPSVV